MKKRIISCLLCISMIIPGILGYADNTVAEDAYMYDFLMALDFMTEDSEGNFNTKRVYTRGEFAELIIKAANISVQAPEAFETLFYDLTSEDPYYAYIKAAVSFGLMKSYEENYFRSEKVITRSQAAYAFAALAGYGELMSIHSDPETIIRRAGIYDGIPDGIEMTKGIIAKMLYNTLHLNQFVPTSYGSDMTYEESEETVLEYYHNIVYGTGVVNRVKNTSLTEPLSENEDTVEIGGTKIKGDLSSDYLGYFVRYYYTDDEEPELVYCQKNEEENEVLTIKAEDILSCNNKKITYWNGNREKTVSIGHTADIIYNNTAYPIATDSDFTPGVGYIELIDNNGDNSYELAKIYSYSIAVVKTYSADVNAIYSKYSNEIFAGKEDDVISVLSSGRKSALSRLGEDTVIAVMQPKCEENRNITVNILPQSSMGKISALSSESITLNGEKYELYDGCVYDRDIALDDDVEVYEFDGMAVAVLHREGAGNNYGYLIAATKEGSDLNDNVDGILFKLYNNKGEITVYNTVSSLKLNGSRVKDAETLLTRLNESAQMSTFYTPEYSYAQPIMYMLNGNNEIIAIATAANTDISVDFEKGPSGDFKYSNASRGLYNFDDKSFAFSIAANSQLMYVPVNKKDDQVYYNSRLGTNLSRLKSYKAEAFNLSEDNESEFVVIYSAENGGIENTAVPGILTQMAEVYDEETQSVKTQLTFVGNSSTPKEYIVSEDCTIPDLNIGDVVAFNTNYKGEILTLDRRFNITSVPDKASRMKITNAPSGNYLWFESESMVKYGTFYNVGTERIGHTTTLPNENMSNIENYNNYYTSGVLVYVYDSDSHGEKVRQGQKNDIIPYNVDSTNASVGCVVTNIGAVKYVYVVK